MNSLPSLLSGLPTEPVNSSSAQGTQELPRGMNRFRMAIVGFNVFAIFMSLILVGLMIQMEDVKAQIQSLQVPTAPSDAGATKAAEPTSVPTSNPEREKELQTQIDQLQQQLKDQTTEQDQLREARAQAESSLQKMTLERDQMQVSLGQRDETINQLTAARDEQTKKWNTAVAENQANLKIINFIRYTTDRKTVDDYISRLRASSTRPANGAGVKPAGPGQPSNPGS